MQMFAVKHKDDTSQTIHRMMFHRSLSLSWRGVKPRGVLTSNVCKTFSCSSLNQGDGVYTTSGYYRGAITSLVIESEEEIDEGLIPVMRRKQSEGADGKLPELLFVSDFIRALRFCGEKSYFCFSFLFLHVEFVA